MSMTFYYGAFTHPANEVAFLGIRRELIYSPSMRANILRESWSLKGRIIDTSQAAILADLAIRRQVYSQNITGNSAGMISASGTTPFVLNAATSIGGVIVTNAVSHGPLMGAETSQWCNYTFGLQADSFVSSINDLLSYQETVTFDDCGGGPLQITRVPVSGLPIIQNRTTNSFFDAMQSGSASSRNPNIQPEQMIWPQVLLGEMGSQHVSYFSPKTERGVPLEYGVQWAYRYRSITPLTGLPHARG